MSFWADLKKPEGTEVGAYAYLTNQLGHYVLGAALFQILGLYYLVAVVLYLLLWEGRHWNGTDSFIDTLFVALGALPAFVIIPLAVVITWRISK